MSLASALARSRGVGAVGRARHRNAGSRAGPGPSSGRLAAPGARQRSLSGTARRLRPSGRCRAGSCSPRSRQQDAPAAAWSGCRPGGTTAQGSSPGRTGGTRTCSRPGRWSDGRFVQEGGDRADPGRRGAMSRTSPRRFGGEPARAGPGARPDRPRSSHGSARHARARPHGRDRLSAAGAQARSVAGAAPYAGRQPPRPRAKAGRAQVAGPPAERAPRRHRRPQRTRRRRPASRSLPRPRPLFRAETAVTFAA